MGTRWRFPYWFAVLQVISLLASANGVRPRVLNVYSDGSTVLELRVGKRSYLVVTYWHRAAEV